MGLIALINKILDFVKSKPRLHNYYLRVGIFVATKRSLGMLVMLLKAILSKKIVLQQRYGENTWAVITGAASGIGRAFAIRLGKEGFNIVAIDVNKEKLQELQGKIREEGREFCGIVGNFKKTYFSGEYDRIFDQLKGKQLSILVNNVGIAEVYRYEEYPIEKMYDMVNVNIMSQMIMTNHVLPLFLKRLKRSAIINMSSMSSELPPSYLGVYAGTKAFNRLFAESLHYEVNSRNVDVLTAAPYFITTNMTMNKKENLWISPDMFVSSVIKSLGKTNFTVGHWKHKLIKGLSSMVNQEKAMKHAGQRLIKQTEEDRGKLKLEQSI